MAAKRLQNSFSKMFQKLIGQATQYCHVAASALETNPHCQVVDTELNTNFQSVF